tara:strand:+ start:64 stop:654 length:591 start_codon:yes stop_codon:yes gene_type:complete
MTEWYRNTDWNDDIKRMFFAKLGRARSQRDQYLVLQAHHLSQSHPDVSLRLIDHYFETRTDDFDDGRARGVAAAAQFASGGYVEALDNYMLVLKGQEANQDLYVGSPLQFAFLTARFRSDTHYGAAQAHLTSVDLPADEQFEPRFRYCAASALLHAATGRDPARALAMAQIALGLPQPVLDSYPDVVWRLRGITRS